MNDRENFMRRAIALSIEMMEKNQGGPFGCVIVKDGKILAEGYNRVTSTNDPTAHAEVVAIREACRALGTFQLADCEVYTSCEPCPMCLAALYWARPKKVYFANTKEDAAAIGFDDKLIYDETYKPVSERLLPMGQMLHAEALTAFRRWQEKPDKILY